MTLNDTFKVMRYSMKRKMAAQCSHFAIFKENFLADWTGLEQFSKIACFRVAVDVMVDKI